MYMYKLQSLCYTIENDTKITFIKSNVKNSNET